MKGQEIKTCALYRRRRLVEKGKRGIMSVCVSFWSYKVINSYRKQKELKVKHISIQKKEKQLTVRGQRVRQFF